MPSARPPRLVARLLAAVLALAVAAWFGLGVIQAHGINRAGAILAQNQLTPRQASQAASLLSRAATLNPDRQVDILRARLDLLQGREPAATRILEGVVRAEPDNIQAWVALAATHPRPPELPIAIGEIDRLDPRIAHGNH